MGLYKKIVDIEDMEYLLPIGSEVFTWNLFVWSTASSTDFPNAQAIFSNWNTWETHTYNIWVIWEAIAHATDVNIWWVGLYWAWRTNWAVRSAWVIWDASVSATWDTGSAIWVRGYATNTHAGGSNIWLYWNASWWATNYALYMEAGNIFSVTAQTWTLIDNNASALTIDSTWKTWILKIISTDWAEWVSMSWTLNVTWVITTTATHKVNIWLDAIHYEMQNWWLSRFKTYLTGTESGSNAWWAFRISSYTDAWGFLAECMTISRALWNTNFWNGVPAVSAKLQVTSTTQWFLPPLMTTTQKNAIWTPATWLVVFDSTLWKLAVFSGTWQTVTSV